jgi:CRISPR-associated protein Cas7/Csh2, subtype I-B/HMARI
MSDLLKNRREILFLYDVSFGNPNGDPNDLNKPRIDEETGKNIVTDVRLKRTVRDYLMNFEGFEIFVKEIAKEDGSIQDAKARAKDFNNDPDKILNECIDVRLFGATIPIKTDKGKEKGDSITYTGPVQFAMGQSLHRVKLEYIKGTGAFASDEKKQQKTFREEYIIPYSLIAFHGVVNENAAKHTKLKQEDVDYLLKALWLGTKNLISRSKTEHMPRLLIEIVYKEGKNFHIGELHRYVKLQTDKLDEEIRSFEDYELDLSKLYEAIDNEAQNIEKVLYMVDRNLNIKPDIPQGTVKWQKLSLEW